MKHRTVRAPERATAGPVVGVLAKHGRFWTVEPFFGRGRRVNVDRPRNARTGDLVLAVPHGRGGGHGRIVRRIGRPDTARDVLEALMLDRGLRRRFDPLVEREAREPSLPEVPRRDLRALPTFTIDPPTARDFDDAISAEALDDGLVRVWVHIADVAAHVRPGSHVDREAFRRGTSVYVPGLVEPMLPEALSDQACSLVPHQDRLAVTVELDMDGATVRRSAFHRSIIRSDKRLTYPEVDAVFAGSARAEEPWAEPLEAARRVATALQTAREARGGLEVDSEEPEFAFSREGHVTALVPSEQTESHRLIEHLMIAANEAVATLLESRKLPALYRVHERPEPARVERLADQLESLDVPTPPLRQSMTPQQAADAVAEMARLVAQEVRRRGHGRIAFTSLVLRSLKQAHAAELGNWKPLLRISWVAPMARTSRSRWHWIIPNSCAALFSANRPSCRCSPPSQWQKARNRGQYERHSRTAWRTVCERLWTVRCVGKGVSISSHKTDYRVGRKARAGIAIALHDRSLRRLPSSRLWKSGEIDPPDALGDGRAKRRDVPSHYGRTRTLPRG